MTDHDVSASPEGSPDVSDRLRHAAREIKPRLRGWLHAATWPLAFAAFVVLIVLSPQTSVRAGAAIFMVCALLLFGVSAVYHTGRWSENVDTILRRVDHANIVLMIAGSYTPFCLILLDDRDATIMLSVVWGGALIGTLFRVFWLTAPRWLYVGIYLLLGWAALLYWGEFADAASTTVLTLIVVGGALYSIGGLVYGFKWPDPFPRWFGFHEVFHALTIAAFVVHFIGVAILASTR